MDRTKTSRSKKSTTSNGNNKNRNNDNRSEQPFYSYHHPTFRQIEKWQSDSNILYDRFNNITKNNSNYSGSTSNNNITSSSIMSNSTSKSSTSMNDSAASNFTAELGIVAVILIVAFFRFFFYVYASAHAPDDDDYHDHETETEADTESRIAATTITTTTTRTRTRTRTRRFGLNRIGIQSSVQKNFTFDKNRSFVIESSLIRIAVLNHQYENAAEFSKVCNECTSEKPNSEYLRDQRDQRENGDDDDDDYVVTTVAIDFCHPCRADKVEKSNSCGSPIQTNENNSNNYFERNSPITSSTGDNDYEDEDDNEDDNVDDNDNEDDNDNDNNIDANITNFVDEEKDVCTICLDSFKIGDIVSKSFSSTPRSIAITSTEITSTNNCPISNNTNTENEIVDETGRGNSQNHQCHHIFHHACIKEWLLRNDSCPTCRVVLVKQIHSRSRNVDYSDDDDYYYDDNDYDNYKDCEDPRCNIDNNNPPPLDVDCTMYYCIQHGVLHDVFSFNNNQKV